MIERTQVPRDRQVKLVVAFVGLLTSLLVTPAIIVSAFVFGGLMWGAAAIAYLVLGGAKYHRRLLEKAFLARLPKLDVSPDAKPHAMPGSGSRTRPARPRNDLVIDLRPGEYSRT